MIRCVEAFGWQDQHGQLSACMGRSRASLAEDGERGARSAHSRGVLKCGPDGKSELFVVVVAIKWLQNTIQLLPVAQVAQKSPSFSRFLKLVIDYILIGPMQNLSAMLWLFLISTSWCSRSSLLCTLTDQKKTTNWLTRQCWEVLIATRGQCCSSVAEVCLPPFILFLILFLSHSKSDSKWTNVVFWRPHRQTSYKIFINNT